MDEHNGPLEYRPSPKRIKWGASESVPLEEGQQGKAPPGTAEPEGKDVPRPADATVFTCIDYCPENFQIKTYTEPSEILGTHRPEWSTVRWINVDGLANVEAIRAIAKKYELHPLVVEDIFNLGHRPKAEDYKGADGLPDRLFVIARQLQVTGGYLCSEQVSFFLGRHTLITFQENTGDVFEPIRQRIKSADSKLRRSDASMLLYMMLDTLVDAVFPILESYAERLEILEETVLSNPTPVELQAIHQVKRELQMVRRAVWPMRDVIHQLQREPHVCLSEQTQVYFRDIYDHVIQIIDLLETYREFAAGLTETYMSAVSNRMNDIMKTLTIITTIFVPLTFLAGVYGMNMPIPENKYDAMYAVFWIISVTMAVGMLIMFRKRKWI